MFVTLGILIAMGYLSDGMAQYLNKANISPLQSLQIHRLGDFEALKYVKCWARLVKLKVTRYFSKKTSLGRLKHFNNNLMQIS